MSAQKLWITQNLVQASKYVPNFSGGKKLGLYPMQALIRYPLQGSTEGQISTAVAEGFAPSATAMVTERFIRLKAEVF